MKGNVSALVFALILCGCSAVKSSTSSNTAPATQLSGDWEFKATSQTNNTLYIETVLTASSGQFYVFGGDSMVFVATTDSGTTTYDSQQAICTAGPLTFKGVVGDSNSLTLAFSDSLDSYTGTGQVNSPSSVSGTYTSTASSDCPYSGSFTGTAVQPLTGSFSGTLNLSEATDNIYATLSQTGNSLTLTGTSTGTDDGSYTLTGVGIANSFQVEGTIQNDAVSISGIYLPEQGQIYVYDTANSNNYAGVLTLQ